MYIRFLKLEETAEDSLFLWGARQAGKSTLLETLFPSVRRYDLLKNEEFERLFRNPALLREELENADPRDLVIIDEVQKIPHHTGNHCISGLSFFGRKADILANFEWL